MKFTIKNKIIAVTGGCGTLGSKYVEEIIKNDAIPIIIDRPQKEPKNFAEIISQKFNCPAYAYECDLTSEKNIISVFSEISNNFGKLDVVINNAAVTGEDLLKFKDKDPFPPFENYPLNLWEFVLKVNLTAPFLVARESYKLLNKSKNPSLINISSVYGVVAPDHRIYKEMEFASFASYSATKAGIHGLTIWLSTYWGNEKIRVNTLSPGGIDNNHTKKFKKRYSDRVPLGRMGNPNDMSGIILYLASDASQYCTGQNFIIDGGLSVW